MMVISVRRVLDSSVKGKGDTSAFGVGDFSVCGDRRKGSIYVFFNVSSSVLMM
jgi:hypothetical protein